MDTQISHPDWFSNMHKTASFNYLREHPIAYFCAEFALSADLPIYAGGLGILAGDVVREAYDQKFPLVAVGLLYQTSYHAGQVIPIHNELELVNDLSGKPLIIKVPIQDGEVSVKVWKWSYKTIPVYLMDTRVETNSVEDVSILQRLYADNKETRLKQQMILGIGGHRMLEALRILPSLYHLNEGHSALLTIELIHHEMKKRKIAFDEAKQFAKRKVVFTNHTLVAAGNELYPTELVAMLFKKYAIDLGIPNNNLVELGQIPQSTSFSMTTLSLRMAAVVNAVSTLHSQKAKTIWADYPMVGITNGVHVPTWDRCSQLDNTVKIQPGDFWNIHSENKKRLLSMLKKSTDLHWGEDDLIIGWARRVVPYKQPLLLFEDIARLKSIITKSERPVRFLFGGKIHPSDKSGQQLIESIQKICAQELPEHCYFFKDYNMETSPYLTSGCDIWLNTPIVGYEACGTSGMKAALNGVLPFSTNDGWIFETDLTEKGWIIQEVNSNESLLDTLENQIIPLFNDRKKNIPLKWEYYMLNARNMIKEGFSGTRMLREYAELLYM